MQKESFLKQNSQNPKEERSRSFREKMEVSSALEGTMEKRKVILPRSKTYFRAMEQVDDEKEEVIEKIVKKMPLNNKLIGILSGCKIPGCIIHAIDKEGNILEHYKSENEIPEELQEGYQMFLQHEGCFSVEVYTLYYCIVYPNGSVKFYEREAL